MFYRLWRLAIEEVFEPELTVGSIGVGALVAVIAVHTVRIDHEVELLASLVHRVNKLEGILVVDIVVTGTMSKFEHHRLNER